MRRWFVGGTEARFRRPDALLQLRELALGSIEALAERTHESIELANELVLKSELHLQVFDPSQRPPEERRKINVEVTRWLNECLGLNLTDGFCGFKAYNRRALECFEVTDLGYAMPLQIWVQAVQHGLKVVEVPVPLIYLDEARAFGGSLDDSTYRLNHYRKVFSDALNRAGLEVAGGCRG